MSSKCQWCNLLCAVCRIGCFRCCQRLCGKESVSSRPEYSIIALGLGGAGKSCLLAKLSAESTDNLQPTTGFSVKVVQLQEAILNIKELGGGEKVRKYWQHYYDGVEGLVCTIFNKGLVHAILIFVVDSSSSEDDLELAASELHGALSHPSLANMPLLVLANKQDVTGCKKMEELTRIFNLDAMARGRASLVHPCSVQNIDDVRDGLHKLVSLLAVNQQPTQENRI